MRLTKTRRTLRQPTVLAVLGAVMMLFPLSVVAGRAEARSPTTDSTVSDSTDSTDSTVSDSTDSTAPDGGDGLQILAVEETGDEIVLDVAVPPAIGRLAPIDNNFAVTDGGPLVDLTITRIGTATDTVLVLDTSGSMRGSALAAAKAAAGSFVRAAPDDARIGLISFGDSVEVHRNPTDDRSGLLADIDELAATGQETVLWDALLVAADMVGGSQPGQSVVVLSDGDDTASSADAADAAGTLGAGPAVLYAVAIESPDTDLVALEEVVDLVGGQFLATTDLGRLDTLYTEIAGRLANRYRLRFEPAQRGTRTIVVSVAADGRVATARITIDGFGGTGGPVAGGAYPVPGAPLGAPPPVLNQDGQPTLGAVAAPSPGLLADPAMLWIGLGLLFGAIAVVGLMIARPAAQVRLNAAEGADRLGGINARLGRAADRLISNHDKGRLIDSRLEAADINIRPGEFVLTWLLVTMVVALSAAALIGVALGIMVIPTAAVGALLILRVRADRRRSEFAEQLTETLGIMAGSLRAGQSLPRSIDLVAAEAPSPTAEQFHRISFEVRVGRDLTDSIRDTAERMASPDLEWLAQAVDINRELGGDLTEILDNVAATIRERRTVARQIDALSAEGRATGWVLLGMPVVLFLFSWWRTPDSIVSLVTEPTGRVLLGFAVAGMTVGHFWIRHMIKLKY